MDGKIKIFNLDGLLKSPQTALSESYFVETTYGVAASDYFNLNG